jgi:hypothetical protein
MPMSHCIDDIVVCKVKDGRILVHNENIFDEKLSFKIIGVQRNDLSDEFVIYVPEYLLGKVQTGMRVSHHTCKSFYVDYKFIGDYMMFIRKNNIVSVEWKSEGMYCEGKCNEYFQWAGPNQEDGTFICGPCRENPWR